MVNQKKKSPNCLKQGSDKVLQEIKDDLWHQQLLKVDRVGNFINLFFFKLPNFGILIPEFFESLKSHHSSNINFFMH